MAGSTNPVHKTAAISARKREKRRRRLVFIFAGLLIAAAALIAGYQFWFRDSSFVEINNLTVKGVTTDTTEGKQIEAAVKLAMDQMTTLDVKPDELHQELARFPRVESSSIQTKFPHTAAVTVRERGDGSIYGKGAAALMIATDGTVLGSPGDQVDKLPLIGVGSPPVHGRLTGRALTQAEILGLVPKELESFVVESSYGPDGAKVTLTNGMTLIFGDATQTTQKWRAAASVIADTSVPSSSYVDLTVPRRPAVRATEGSD